jgi:hypothetical protein
MSRPGDERISRPCQFLQNASMKRFAIDAPHKCDLFLKTAARAFVCKGSARSILRFAIA